MYNFRTDLALERQELLNKLKRERRRNRPELKQKNKKKMRK